MATKSQNVATGAQPRRPQHEQALPIGTEVPPFGTIRAILWTGGERYYHFIDRDGCVSMMPDDDFIREHAKVSR